MADTGWVLVGTGANSNPGSGTAWTNAGNITADDGIEAQVNTLGNNTNTQFLHGTNLGLSIPANQVIVGVEVRIQRRAGSQNANGVRDETVQLIVGGTRSGDNNADTVTEYPLTVANKDYGGAADLWGLSLSTADVEASDFGVALRSRNESGFNTFVAVDVIWMKVHYEDAPADEGAFFQLF